MKKNLYIFLILLFFSPSFAFASWLDDDSYGKGTFGEVFKNFGDQISSVDGLLRIICYITGLILGMSGVLKIRDHVDQPGKVSIKEPLMRIAAGAFFIALPTFILIIINTTIGVNGSLDLNVDID